MAYGRYVSVELASNLVGSYLEANYPEQKLQDVQLAYNGTAGSVVVLINR